MVTKAEHDPFADWQCLTCGLVSSGSVTGDHGEELPRRACRFCQTARPDLGGWVLDPEHFWYHPEHPPASLELRAWRRAHPWEFDPAGP